MAKYNLYHAVSTDRVLVYDSHLFVSSFEVINFFLMKFPADSNG